MAFEINNYHFNTEPLFTGMPAEMGLLIENNRVTIELQKGKELFKEGNFSNGVYTLETGKIKIYQVSKTGKEQIVYFYREGEILGYRPLLCNEPHPVSAMALEDSVITFLPKDTFLKILESSTLLSKRLLFNLSHEFSVWVNKFTVFAQQPVKDRIVLALLILNEKYKRNGTPNDSTEINLSRDDLANYIGCTKETLVRGLAFFKKEHIIKTDGQKIIVIDPDVLVKFVE